MTVSKSNHADLVDMDKMIRYMTGEINLYWSEMESNNGYKLHSIHKVPQHILEVDRNAYEPIVLSVGPYHHGAPNLTAMEKEKCLDFILKLNCELSLQGYVRAIYKLEKEARCYYSQEVSMNKTKFVQMLLLDSCFILVKVDGTIAVSMQIENVNVDSTAGIINDRRGECPHSGQAVETNFTQRQANDNSVHEIELTYDNQIESKSNGGKYEQSHDHPYDYSNCGDWYAIFVWHDLFLLENQIPFFIVETVYDLASRKHRARALLRDKIVECVEDILRQFPKGTEHFNRPKEFHHLLHLCHMHMRTSHNFVGTNDHQLKVRLFHRLVHFGQRYFSLSPSQEENERQEWLTHSTDCFQGKHLPNHWRQAVQYHETGVQLKKREYSICDRHSLLDIKFCNGVLEVPCFLIDENTESLFKNLIAFEQMDPQLGNDMTAYIAFMSQFVSTSEDAALLIRKGIIVHMLAMFTRLGTHMHFDFGADNYHYLKILCFTLEQYYQNRLNRWMAWLWRNHFSNPWLALGAFAAVIVLLCTIVQTVFTVLAYKQPN